MALFVRFYNDAVEDKKRSREEGRPIFRDVEMCEIRFPGDRYRTLVVPAQEKQKINGEKITYAQQYPREYEAFKMQRTYMGEGTPLREAPFLTEGRRRELERLNIHTVDQFAAMDATTLNRMGMGYLSLKEQAVAYLERAKETVATMDRRKMAEEMAELRAQIEQLRAGDAAPVDAFDAMTDAELRGFIKMATGHGPAGQPGRTKLLAMAREAAAAPAESEAA